ncbi:MAG TPA: M20/M25/M40 family metallo-hydrolase [Gemmatimonadales bacterium]|nr:M20/M25/M40 family metallo-hydrolase [Gemmatimonadales bacterium]
MKHAHLTTVIAPALLCWIFGSAAAEPGAAQQSTRARNAGRPELAPEELRRVVALIADDSMAGRATPSRELNLAAEYLAHAFSSAGLMPLGDDGTFLQRFPVTETTLDQRSARVDIGSLATWRFGTDYWHVGGMGGVPVGELRGSVVIVSGKITRESVAELNVRGKLVIYRSPLNARGAPTDVGGGFALGAAGALAVLVPGNRPDTLWRRIGRDPDEHKPATHAAWPVWTAASAPLAVNAIRFMPVLEVWGGRFDALLARAGLDTSMFAAPDAAPKVVALDADGVFRFEREIRRVSWAPNVVAMLPGRDPILRHEYVIVTAHLDGLGRSPHAPPGPENVLNGADDNASGVAAILQMAKALVAAPRPKRSVVFVAVSGEELGLWGSDYFAARPPVPVASIVANINMDMVGRANGDSVYVTGRNHPVVSAVVGAALTRERRGLHVLDEAALNARYPNERFDERSDSENFRRRGIPSVSFFTGPHTDYHETTDDVATLNYDSLSRIASLALDVTVALADGTLPPRPGTPRR